MFANMYAAYDALSEPMKRFLEGLTAIHDGEHVYRGRYQYTTDPNKVFPGPGIPSSVHTRRQDARRCSSTGASRPELKG